MHETDFEEIFIKEKVYIISLIKHIFKENF